MLLLIENCVSTKTLLLPYKYYVIIIIVSVYVSVIVSVRTIV